MATNFDPFIRVVMNMMSRFGGDGELHMLSETPDNTYDPSTGTVNTTSKVYKIRTIVLDYTDKKDGIGTYLPTTVVAGDKQMFIKPDAVLKEPKPGVDRVTYMGVEYGIVTIKQLNTSGKNCVLYELHIRQ